MMLSNQQAREKKGWKAIQADYDFVLSLSDRKCSYCLTDQQVAIVLAVAESFHWPTRWYSSTQDIDSDVIDALASGLEKALMSGCCDDNLPIRWRYSEDGVLQRSLNAGGTWVDAPEYDTRNYSPIFPPIAGDDGDDKKCLAAAGAAQLIKEQVGSQITDDMTRYTLGDLISDWVAVWLESTDLLKMLLTVITNQIFALVLSALVPALTDEVYEQLQCVLYCNMADDGSFNTAQWEEAREDTQEQISGIAGLFLQHLIYVLGPVGLTNVSRAGGVSGEVDCSECDCEGCNVELYAPPSPAIAPEYMGDCTWRYTSFEDGGSHVAYIWFNNPTGVFDVNACGKILGRSIVSGAIDDIGGITLCTSGTYVENGDPSINCCCQVYYNSNMPFVVDVIGSGC